MSVATTRLRIGKKTKTFVQLMEGDPAQDPLITNYLSNKLYLIPNEYPSYERDKERLRMLAALRRGLPYSVPIYTAPRTSLKVSIDWLTNALDRTYRWFFPGKTASHEAVSA